MSTLRVDQVQVNGELTSILCKDGKIASIGGQPEADEVFDGQGMIAHPPLNNAHTHAAMTLFRGNGDDLPLMEWLTTRVWPYENSIQFDEVYWGTKLAIVEMIRAGTVFFNDMYWNFHAVAKAVDEMGVRAALSAVFLDLDDPKQAEKQKELNKRLFEEVQQYSDRIEFVVGPHAIYTVSADSLRWAAQFTAEHNLKLHIHLSETTQEVADCKQKHGVTPVQFMHRLGCLSDRLVAAHTVVLTDEDIALLAEHNVLSAHNPVSNLKLAVGGNYPYGRLKEAGVRTAISTDGAGSNNNLDLFEEMKVATLLQKFVEKDPTLMPASKVIELTTKTASEFFGLNNHSIEVGSTADFILIDPNRPEMTPLHDLASQLVYAANGNVVDSVVCDGRLLMRHREIEGEEEVLTRAREAARTLFDRVDNSH